MSTGTGDDNADERARMSHCERHEPSQKARHWQLTASSFWPTASECGAVSWLRRIASIVVGSFVSVALAFE